MTKKVLGVVLAGLVLAGTAFAATTYKSTSTFKLQSGEYCYQETHGLTGNKFKVQMMLTSGACSGSGETVVVP
jgi:hypothetical protein